MAEATLIEPLQDRVFGGNGVTLTPLNKCERISLRAEDKAVAGLGKAIGLSLPTKPGTSVTKSGISALLIGPDEWFVTGPQGSNLEEKLNGVTGALYSVVSVDHRNTGLTISGPKAVLALASGNARDLSMEAFPIGGCSRTQLGKAEIILWRLEENRFHIECWRSFSDYVWKFLVDAARTA